MCLEIGARGTKVVERGPRSDKAQQHQPAGSVVDESQQRAGRPAILKPGVLGAVNLHQLANAVAAPARLVR